MNELKTRGVEDVLIAIVDGLKGLDAGASAYAHRTRLELDDFADGSWARNYRAIARVVAAKLATGNRVLRFSR